ncbi:hypothetical protein Q6247_25580 [Klebsiella pneumoniae]
MKKIKKFIPYIKKQLTNYHNLINNNKIFLNHIKNINIYNTKKTISYSLNKTNLQYTKIN